MVKARTSLIQDLIEDGILKTPEIIAAFEKIDRADFLPEDLKRFAYIDEALPIGEGQTISQPLTVAFMLELLSPKKGEFIMDIGSGSGWQTAILAFIVGEKDKVYAIERIKELCDFGKTNIAKYNFIKKGIVEIFCQDASAGLLDTAEKIGGFDGIILAAALRMADSGPESALPKTWKKQLKIGGRIVAPIENSIWLFTKNKDGSFSGKEYPGFVFVPFVPKNKELI